jgi:hypothetical protein
MTTSIVLTPDIRRGGVTGASFPWPRGATLLTATGLLSDADASDPSNTCTFSVEVSFDGGKGFDFAAGGGWAGGVGKDGTTPAPPALALSYGGDTPTHALVLIDLPKPLSIGASLTF